MASSIENQDLSLFLTRFAERVKLTKNINENNWYQYIGLFGDGDINEISGLLPEINMDLIVADWAARFQSEPDKLVKLFNLLELHWNVIFNDSHMQRVLSYVYNATIVLEFFNQRSMLDVKYAEYASDVSLETVKYMCDHGLDVNEMAKSCMMYEDDGGFDQSMLKLSYLADNGADLSGLIKEIKQDFLSQKITPHKSSWVCQ
jgi:hypothetical protein